MLPSMQPNFAAQYASQRAHHIAANFPVQATMNISRNVALLVLADRLVGDLSDQLAKWLGIESTVRQVLISAETQQHAIDRRAISSRVDADLVALRIAEAFANLRFLLLPQQDPHVFALVGWLASSDRWLVMPLKFIPSQLLSEKPDQLWIRTAYPLGRQKMRKFDARGLLRELPIANVF